MKNVKIFRLEQSAEHGTLGAMVVDGDMFATTLELPDRDNQTNVSRIPAGVYICHRIISPKYGDVFEVAGVPGRSHILIHAGNTDDHTQGCILIGQYPGKLRGNRAVLNSGNTLRQFMVAMGDERHFQLTIEDHDK